jgi:hypothetical protein
MGAVLSTSGAEGIDPSLNPALAFAQLASDTGLHLKSSVGPRMGCVCSTLILGKTPEDFEFFQPRFPEKPRAQACFRASETLPIVAVRDNQRVPSPTEVCYEIVA